MEFWKTQRSIKRVLSLVKVIADAWDKFSKKMSHAKNWVEKFMKGKQYYMELCG